MQRPAILLTAFEPFGGDPRNPSAEVLAAVAADPPVGGLVADLLPVVFDSAGRRVARLLAEHRPAAWVGLGLHAGAAAVTLERWAANRDDAALADNAGDVRRDVPIDPAGPPSRPATLPLAAIHAALTAAGVTAVYSDSAGRFVCNHTFYRAAAAAGLLDPPPRVGFVHLPWPADWPAPRGRRVGHALTFADLVTAVRACLAVTAAVVNPA